jgi:hypothetical protein
MSGKDVSKDVLNVVKKKTGKQVSRNDIYKLASGVKPTTMQSDAQLRQLIKQVAGLVNAPVSDKMMNDIISAVKGSQGGLANMEQLIRMMTGK